MPLSGRGGDSVWGRHTVRRAFLRECGPLSGGYPQPGTRTRPCPMVGSVLFATGNSGQCLPLKPIARPVTPCGRVRALGARSQAVSDDGYEALASACPRRLSPHGAGRPCLCRRGPSPALRPCHLTSAVPGSCPQVRPLGMWLSHDFSWVTEGLSLLSSLRVTI